jgi:hypothetical protein
LHQLLFFFRACLCCTEMNHNNLGWVGCVYKRSTAVIFFR